MPYPTYVEIVADDRGFYLFRYNDAGEGGGDTWHESVDRAKAQAKFQYDIEATDWTVAN